MLRLVSHQSDVDGEEVVLACGRRLASAKTATGYTSAYPLKKTPNTDWYLEHRRMVSLSQHTPSSRYLLSKHNHGCISEQLPYNEYPRIKVQTAA